MRLFTFKKILTYSPHMCWISLIFFEDCISLICKLGRFFVKRKKERKLLRFDLGACLDWLMKSLFELIVSHKHLCKCLEEFMKIAYSVFNLF